MPLSEDDELGARYIVILIGTFLAFATLCVLFSCYRICIEKRLKGKLQQLTPIEVEPIPIYNIVNQTLQNTDVTATQQSDRQLVFGSQNISTAAADVFTLAINQDTVRHRPLAELQLEYERRARERRANLDNKDDHSLPPYNSKDETLPSYDQAVRCHDK